MSEDILIVNFDEINTLRRDFLTSTIFKIQILFFSNWLFAPRRRVPIVYVRVVAVTRREILYSVTPYVPRIEYISFREIDPVILMKCTFPVFFI